MLTAWDVEDKIYAWAPKEYRMDWDNTGLLCGRQDREVRRILVALDPTFDVCEEAAEVGADLLVTHHPLIFQPLKCVTDQDAAGKALLYLIGHDIAAINAHTNLDQAVGGVNDCLAEILGLRDIEVPSPCGMDPAGRPWGLLRCGNVDEMPLREFAAAVKEKLACSGLRFLDSERPVRRVAVGGGACADELETVRAAGCDTFVTADVKYHQFQDALNMGINLIDAGHFETENPICRRLAEYLRRSFPETEVVLSKKHGDPVQFI